MWSQDQGKAIANAIQLGNATGISDGSYKNNRGTAACVTEENNNEDSRIYAVHDTPGEMSDQSPYRSKLGGISMMLAILRCIVQCYGITKGSTRLGLDGKKQWNRLEVPSHFTLPNDPLICWWISGQRYNNYLFLSHCFGWRVIKLPNMVINHT